MKNIKKILFVLTLSFCFMNNVCASKNYLSVNNIEDLINESYTGLIEYDNNFYYLLNGEIVKNNTILIDEEEYYFNEDGIMQEDDNTIDNVLDDLSIQQNSDSSIIDNNASNDENLIKESEEEIKQNENSEELNSDKNMLNILGNNLNNNLQTGWVEFGGDLYYIYEDGTKATGWVTIDDVKCYFSDSGILIEKNALKIIDVSHHKGEIDWNKVKNTDVDGAIVRLGYGTSYTTDDPVIDRYWDANYEGTTNQELLFGIYLYSYAIDYVSANLEADFVIDNLDKKGFDKNLVVYYDIEDNAWTENLTQNDYDIIINTFVDRLNKKGYKAQVYSYKYWAENKLSDNAREKLTWIAHYNEVCKYSGTYIGWQYTDSGSVDGIIGSVDISVFKNTNKKFAYLEYNGTDPIEIEEGTVPNLSNIVVYKVYSNNDKEQTTDYTYSKEKMKLGTESIKISYTEDGVTSTIEIPVSVIKKNQDTEEVKQYDVIEVKDKTINKLAMKDLIIKVDANHELFDNLFIDDKLVDPNNYVITQGSTIITIFANYLNTLDTGMHTVKATFKDGKEASTTINVIEPKRSNENIVKPTSYKLNTNKVINPKTGDNIITYILLAFISLLGISYFSCISIKNYNIR